jgi:hypothetical protein
MKVSNIDRFADRTPIGVWVMGDEDAEKLDNELRDEKRALELMAFDTFGELEVVTVSERDKRIAEYLEKALNERLEAQP